MVPEKYRLEAVGRFLIESFERRRPGLASWTPQVEAQLMAEAEAELVQMEHQCRELGIDDGRYWRKVRGALQAVLLPRYAALARSEIALAQREYGLWRGGDLVARLAFACVGLALGGLAVAIPWIPVTEKWVPWALFLGGPFLPDAQMWWFRRRYQKKIDALVADLGRAGNSLDTYRSIAELQRTLGEPMTLDLVRPELMEGPPVPESSEAEPGSTIGKVEEPQGERQDDAKPSRTRH